MKPIKKSLIGSGLLLLGTLAATGLVSYQAISASGASDPAIERTRQEVRMLDSLYKNLLVLITDHYVKDAGSLPAATAAKALFAEMKKEGWYEVRLLGLTNFLNNPEDRPKDAFERAAAEKLGTGQTGYEEVVENGGKRYLRMATGVPVVMEKCVMCHANFKGNQGNIGALSYTVPVVE